MDYYGIKNQKTEQNRTKQNKGGRKPKVNPKANRYIFRLTDEENAKFLALFDQ